MPDSQTDAITLSPSMEHEMPEPNLFTDVVRDRHAVRSFRPEPVDTAVLRSVLEEAQRSPSNCNTQPWLVHIVSGAKRDELSGARHCAGGSRPAPDRHLAQPRFLRRASCGLAFHARSRRLRAYGGRRWNVGANLPALADRPWPWQHSPDDARLLRRYGA
ncbi:nitroreductase family protein [Corallococcus sp. NCSPR001]|nr:nitroreductase family protein [Corallococcus sp. NCSPR001]